MSTETDQAHSGLLRIIHPREIADLYDNVQGQLDFSDGLREDILSEDGLDFAKFIPVMAGAGTDGYWALLDTSSSEGRIFYWDNDQAGYLEDVFTNLPTFLDWLLDRARGDNPPRMT